MSLQLPAQALQLTLSKVSSVVRGLEVVTLLAYLKMGLLNKFKIFTFHNNYKKDHNGKTLSYLPVHSF